MKILKKIKAALKDVSPKKIYYTACVICFFFMVTGTINLVSVGASFLPQVPKVEKETVNYTEFMQRVHRKELSKATIEADRITAVDKKGHEIVFYHGQMLTDPNLPKIMDDEGIDVSFPKEAAPGLIVYVFRAIGILLPFAFLMFFGAAGMLIYPQVKGKFSGSWIKVRKNIQIGFKDVAGQDEAKSELEEIVLFLKNPNAYSHTGARVPRGVLLIGPPGTGKTRFAEAIAGEAEVPFISVTGSDFSNAFVGVGRDRIESMFKKARKFKKAIIFIDEFDSLARKRGLSSSDVGREQDITLNQLLSEMDGFGKRNGITIVVIAASNLLDVLDPAAIRPGRFDRHIFISLPDMNGREAILKVHTQKKIPLAADVDLSIVARGTPGFSGADLENLVNQAAMIAAARNNGKEVTAHDFEEARDKIVMGAKKKNLSADTQERRLTAYHEAGHALMACANPHSDPVHQATILQRGAALGMVMRLPEKDKLSVTKAQLNADLEVLMAGRAAEEIVFGTDQITSGAVSDIAKATEIATNMVVNWGMSDVIGMRKIEQTGVGYGAQAEREIKDVIDNAYLKAKSTLKDLRDTLDAIAKALLDKETIPGEDIRMIYREYKERKTSA